MVPSIKLGLPYHTFYVKRVCRSRPADRFCPILSEYKKWRRKLQSGTHHRRCQSRIYSVQDRYSQSIRRIHQYPELQMDRPDLYTNLFTGRLLIRQTGNLYWKRQQFHLQFTIQLARIHDEPLAKARRSDGYPTFRIWWIGYFHQLIPLYPQHRSFTPEKLYPRLHTAQPVDSKADDWQSTGIFLGKQSADLGQNGNSMTPKHPLTVKSFARLPPCVLSVSELNYHSNIPIILTK